MKPALLISLALCALAAPADAGWFSRRTPTPTPTPIPVRKALPPPIPTPTPPPRELVALPIYDEDTSVRLQIFLDNHEFGPGKIDGKMGEFFGKALIAYKKANGLPPTGAVDAQLLAQVPDPYTTLHGPDGWILNYVGDVASTPSQQAKLKRMPYSSLLEFVAERYHAEQDFLRKLNPGMDLEKLQPGDTVRVPDVQPFEYRKADGEIHPRESGLRDAADLHRHPRKFSRGARGRSPGSGVSNHARIENAACTEGRLENPRSGDPALVPA